MATSKDLFDLSGRVALVTGSSRGIGEATARLLAAYGAHVILSSRKAESLEPVKESINEAGGKASAIACHGGNLEQIDALYEQIVQEHGAGPDILVNNAATNPYFGHILDTDMGAFDKTVEVNLRGYFYHCVKAGNLMKEKGGGAILNVASINGVRPGQMQGAYSITKGAVINMTKAFAKECGNLGIRVNALLPGLTDTRLASALTQNEEILNHVLPSIPLGRPAQPEEMAGAVLYLVSDAGSYTTGTCLNVDGGALT